MSTTQTDKKRFKTGAALLRAQRDRAVGVLACALADCPTWEREAQEIVTNKDFDPETPDYVRNPTDEVVTSSRISDVVQMVKARQALIDTASRVVQGWAEDPYTQVEKIHGGFGLVEAVRQLSNIEREVN